MARRAVTGDGAAGRARPIRRCGPRTRAGLCLGRVVLQSAGALGAWVAMVMLLNSGLYLRFPAAKLGERNRAGWRTGFRTGRVSPPARPRPLRRHHATDVKKPLEGGCPPEHSGRQARVTVVCGDENMMHLGAAGGQALILHVRPRKGGRHTHHGRPRTDTVGVISAGDTCLNWVAAVSRARQAAEVSSVLRAPSPMCKSAQHPGLSGGLSPECPSCCFGYDAPGWRMELSCLLCRR